MRHRRTKTRRGCAVALMLGPLLATSGVAWALTPDPAWAFGPLPPWTQAAKVTASDGGGGDELGAVALHGSPLLVSAWFDDELGVDAGAGYVFERDLAGRWLELGKLTASDGVAGDTFGWSVAAGESVLVLGTREGDAAYLFEPDGAGWWVEVAKLTPSGGGASSAFGWSAAADGETDPATTQRNLDHCIRLVRDDSEKIFNPPPLLRGDEIRELLDLTPGPEVGLASRRLRRRQIEGRLRDRDAAISWLLSERRSSNAD